VHRLVVVRAIGPFEAHELRVTSLRRIRLLRNRIHPDLMWDRYMVFVAPSQLLGTGQCTQGIRQLPLSRLCCCRRDVKRQYALPYFSVRETIAELQDEIYACSSSTKNIGISETRWFCSTWAGSISDNRVLELDDCRWVETLDLYQKNKAMTILMCLQDCISPLSNRFVSINDNESCQ
jgi:hypothetical protein